MLQADAGEGGSEDVSAGSAETMALGRAWWRAGETTGAISHQGAPTTDNRQPTTLTLNCMHVDTTPGKRREICGISCETW
eukprot:scaffold128389_cov35-Tisochrysis_lutea.AAC.4